MKFIGRFCFVNISSMAVVTQMTTLNSRVPFLHFMDGFRTSHEINKIELVNDEQLKELIPFDKVEEHRQRALSPLHPNQRGTAQAPDVFMQLVESSNKHYEAVSLNNAVLIISFYHTHNCFFAMKVPNFFRQALNDFGSVVGRNYMPFEYYYYGSTKPTIAIVTMGSSVQVVKETLQHIRSEQACVVGVRLFRPWLPADFCKALPLTIKRVASLDRTKESGAQGEPLYMDVCASLMSCNRHGVFVAGGRYGLASKGKNKCLLCHTVLNCD